MILRLKRAVPRFLSAVLAVQLVAVGVSVSLLDAGMTAGDARLEAHADGCGCAPAHDHTLCSQVGSNRVLATARPPFVPHGVVAVIQATAPSLRSAPRLSTTELHPRAPPRA